MTKARAKASVAYAETERLFTVADQHRLAIALHRCDELVEHVERLKLVAKQTQELHEFKMIMNEAKHAVELRETVTCLTNDGYRALGWVNDLIQRLQETRLSNEKVDLLVNGMKAAIGGHLSSTTSHATVRAETKPRFSSVAEGYWVYALSIKQTCLQVMGQDKGTARRFAESAGDKPIDTYTRADVTKFLSLLRQMHVHYGKSDKDHERSIEEIIALSVGKPCLKEKTLKRHLTVLSGIFGHAVDANLLTLTAKADIVGDHRLRASVDGARDQRDAWTDDDLVALFATPVWTGCHPIQRSKPGPRIIRDARFWLPILALYTGARLEELADLQGSEIATQDGIRAIRITLRYDDETKATVNRSIKNPNAKRWIPLHSELIRLGFLTYVKNIAPKDGDPVFPDLPPQGKDARRGKSFTKFFGNYRKSVGLFRKGVATHSLRHNAITQLTQAITTEDQLRARDRFMGHAPTGSEGSQRYDKGPPMAKLALVMELLKYPGLDLSKHYES